MGVIWMKKTNHLSFRLDDNHYLMFRKICDALIVDGEEFCYSTVIRRVLEDEYIMLRQKNLITSGIYQ